MTHRCPGRRRVPPAVGFVLAVVTLVASTARAEPVPPVVDTGGTVSGYVLAEGTSDPIPDARVRLEPLGRAVFTDAEGRFVIRLVPPGSYTIRADASGYDAAGADGVRVLAGRLITQSIRLAPRIVDAGPVVVTATRREQTAKSAPASVVIMSRDEIAARQVTTFDQALEQVPGVAAFRSTPISVQSMSIRGASDVAGGGVGNRVLLLVDGRPALTSDSGGAFWSLVPTGFVDRVEIVKGAFSSLYGSTAMGGVVNVITRRPDAPSRLVVDASAGFYEKAPSEIRYTEDTPLQSQVSFNYSGTRDWVSYLVSASRKQSDGHAQGTSYAFVDLFAKMLFDLPDNRNLEVTLGGGSADADYPHAWLNSSRPLSIRPEYADDEQSKDYFSADVHYWAVPSARQKYSSRFYYYDHRQRSFFNEDDPDGEIPGNEPYGFRTRIDGAKLGNITQVDAYLSDRNYLVAGVDVQIDDVRSSPDSTLYGDHRTSNVALFAQDELRLSERWSATLGLRYDVNHLVSGRTLRQLSPKVSVVWNPTPDVAVRALYGRAFRAPTIAERFLRREIGGGIEFVPNPSLDAERMTASWEAGVRLEPVSSVELDVALFRYDYEDLIYWVDVAGEFGVDYPLFQVRNLNRARMRGVDASVTARWIDAVSASVGYTYLDAEDRSPGRVDDVLAYRPKHSLQASLGGTWRRTQVIADARYRSDVEEVFLFPLQRPSAFWVFGAAVRQRITDRVGLSARVNNLFDARYEELARYRMPGRNWLFGTSVEL